MAAQEITYFELTEATEHAVEDISALLPQLSSTARPLTLDWLQYMMGFTRVFAAADEGRIVGVVLLHPMPILVGQKDWIEDVVVDEAYRRQGISSRLMDMAETESRKGPAKSINLTSNPNREGARKMYGDRGYAIIDTGLFRLTL